ncbi:TlpA disulfide reductase family protein [Phytohalomonas tamaricis]|uniref:TlpA disulfide reductase family protein n=1 Tax=Phytohalomonas tamaricis TaxID=2081032 RepID=UPI000D0B47F9|nr:TlpA disulfide reductase family protein [Phytohalomonas tamaricis]
MDAIAFGGFLLSLPRLYAFICTLVLLFAAQCLLKVPPRQKTHWANGVLLGWLIGARLVDAALNIDAYQAAPLALFMLWQPGYTLWGGLFVTLLWSLWYLRAMPRSCMVAVALLLSVHGVWYALDSWRPFSNAPDLSQLPSLTLENIDGHPVRLDTFKGHPVMINLWASWCPPCRREIPLLADIDTHEQITVITANQGESLLQVLRFLNDRQLSFRHALLDPQQRLMALNKAPGLPVTLLFDSAGRLIAIHTGELTQIQWQKWQQRLAKHERLSK